MGLLDAFKGLMGGNKDAAGPGANTTNNMTMPDPNATSMGGPNPMSTPGADNGTSVGPLDPTAPSATSPTPPVPPATPDITAPDATSGPVEAPTPSAPQEPAGPNTEPTLPHEDAGSSLDSQEQTGEPAPTTVITSDNAPTPAPPVSGQEPTPGPGPSGDDTPKPVV